MRIGDSSGRESRPTLLVLVNLRFQNFDCDDVARVDRLLRDDTQDERGTARGPQFDEENFRDAGAAARDATNHPLTQTEIKATSQEDKVRHAGWFDCHNRRGRRGGQAEGRRQNEASSSQHHREAANTGTG